MGICITSCIRIMHNMPMHYGMRMDIMLCIRVLHTHKARKSIHHIMRMHYNMHSMHSMQDHNA